MPENGWQVAYGRWLDLTAICGLGILFFAVFAPLWATVVACVFHAGALSALWRIRPHRPSGADLITLTRALGVIGLYAATLLGNGWLTLFGLAALAAALDLVDGWWGAALRRDCVWGRLRYGNGPAHGHGPWRSSASSALVCRLVNRFLRHCVTST